MISTIISRSEPIVIPLIRTKFLCPDILCRYFQHYHPFLPIVRSRDPDLCYRCAPLLFWAIIVTACRRYPRDHTTFKFLIESIPAEIWSALGSVPIRPAVINALLILSTWPLPDMRFMTDPTYVYTGTALNACLYLGLHTGKGSFLEFGTPKYRLGSTDEEAIYTWSACNIVSQRLVRVHFLGPYLDGSAHTITVLRHTWVIPQSHLSRARPWTKSSVVITPSTCLAATRLPFRPPSSPTNSPKP